MTPVEQETLLPRLRAALEVVNQTITRVKGTPIPSAPPPVIEAFTVTPATVASGQPVTVSFRVSGADIVSITANPDGPMPSTVIAGDCTLRPAANTTLTLTAHGQGSASMVRSVTVGTPTPIPTPGTLTAVYLGRIEDRTGRHTDAKDGVMDDHIKLSGLLPAKIHSIELHGKPEGEWRFPISNQFYGVELDPPRALEPTADIWFTPWTQTSVVIDVIYSDGRRQQTTCMTMSAHI